MWLFLKQQHEQKCMKDTQCVSTQWAAKNVTPDLPPCRSGFCQAAPDNVPNRRWLPKELPKSQTPPTTTHPATYTIIHQWATESRDQLPPARFCWSTVRPALIVSFLLTQQHNHWMAAHKHAARCVTETAVKPKFWLDCHAPRVAAFSWVR